MDLELRSLRHDAANTNPAGAGAFAYNLRLPGQVFDGQSGLHQNYFRDFDPALGRYVESDPIGLYGGSYATYAYANGNPLINIDAFGLCDAEDKCKKLLKKMDKLVNAVRPGNNPSAFKGLAQRFKAHLRLPPSEIPGHAVQIEQRQRQLRKLIEDYINSACGDPPGFATHYARLPIPVPPVESQNDFSIDPQTQNQAVTNTAEAGVLAIILRIFAGAALAF